MRGVESDGAQPENALSEQQRVANERNAKLSTGPRTETGKRRSSQNSLVHGIYAGATPVPRGPFAENPDVVATEARDIIRALEPEDDVQLAEAHVIAGLHRRIARLSRFEAEAIAAHSDYDTLGNDSSCPDPEAAERATGAAAVRLLRASVADAALIHARLGRELERALNRYEALQKRLTITVGSARLDAMASGETNPFGRNTSDAGEGSDVPE